MKYCYLLIISILILISCSEAPKPSLRQGAFYTEEQGAAELKKLESMYSSRGEWEARKEMLKRKHPERDEFITFANPNTTERRFGR